MGLSYPSLPVLSFPSLSARSYAALYPGPICPVLPLPLYSYKMLHCVWRRRVSEMLIIAVDFSVDVRRMEVTHTSVTYDSNDFEKGK